MFMCILARWYVVVSCYRYMYAGCKNRKMRMAFAIQVFMRTDKLVPTPTFSVVKG